jgi:hypothetical protein
LTGTECAASIGKPMDAETDSEAELREALELIARDRRAMLERIGVALNVGNPEALYRKVIREMVSATTRERLVRAWAAVGEAHEVEVARAVDALGRERRRKTGRTGYRMIEEAVAAQEKLDTEVRAVTGTAHHPAAHFGFALRTVFGDVAAPSFALDECMAFVGRVAKEHLGLELSGSGTERLSFVEAKKLFRGVGEAAGRARKEKYRAGWFEMWAYDHEFAGDYGRLKLAERRADLVPRAVAAVLERTDRVGEEFALLDSRFGVRNWCGLSDVASYLLRGGAGDGLREEAWCCERLPGGGTIFAYYEAVGQLKQSLQS